MLVLAIDTATLVGSIALVDHDLVRGERALYMRGAHGSVVVDAVRALCAQCEVELSAIDAFACGLGPGSFTGVRVGVAVAKGLGLATNKPVFGLGSLELLAASALGPRPLVFSVIDARRDELFFAAYSLDSTGARALIAEPAHERPELVGARLADVARGREGLVVSDLDEGLRARVRDGAGPDAQLAWAPRVMGAPLARLLAHEVITGRAQRDEGSMEPHYVRATDAKLPSKPLAVS